MRKLCLLASSALTIATSAHAVLLVNDTFSDTDRIGGLSGSSTTTTTPAINTPTSTNTQWISAAVSELTASGTGMLWNMSTTSRLVTGYFPTVNLAANSTTTFTLNFTTGNIGTGTTNNLRIALTNDGGTDGIRTTDGSGASSITYVGDTGYAIFSGNNTGGAAPATNLTLNTRERTTLSNVTPANTTLMGTANDWTSFTPSSSGATGNFAGNTAYSLTLALTYTGTQNTITTTVTGGNFANMSYSVIDATPLTAFSQLSFRLGGGSAQFASINFTGFSVDQVSSAVPEPSSYAALAGIAALGLVATRRRRTAV